MRLRRPYLSTYQSFSVSIEREGKLIYFGGDDTVSQLAGDVRSDITAIPFEEHPVVEKDGQTFLHTRYGDYPVADSQSLFLDQSECGTFGLPAVRR